MLFSITKLIQRTDYWQQNGMKNWLHFAFIILSLNSSRFTSLTIEFEHNIVVDY